MASQSFIIEQENKVMAAIAAIKVAREALAIEKKYCDNSEGFYRENQDCWATLAINIKMLQNQCETFFKP